MENNMTSKAMSTLTHGVYILGVHTPEKDNLMTAAWLCQVSSAPAMLAVAVSSGHLTEDLIRKAEKFTVSVLGENQKSSAMACGSASGRNTDKIALVNVKYTQSGIPVIDGALAQMECRVVDINTVVGNHTIFIAEVIDTRRGSSTEAPLLYRAKDFF